ncbi:hypothetical protein ACWD5Z_23865 [Micromonospora chokoriensis]
MGSPLARWAAVNALDGGVLEVQSWLVMLRLVAWENSFAVSVRTCGVNPIALCGHKQV